jgi:hypothetical protein
MTEEERQRRIAALLEERRGYEIHGRKERVAQVDYQLALLGHEKAGGAKRASRPSRKSGQHRLRGSDREER